MSTRMRSANGHLGGRLGEHALARRGDGGRDGHGPQRVRELVHVEQQQHDARGHGDAGHPHAEDRDRVLGDAAEQGVRVGEGADEGREHDLLQAIAVPQAHVPGRQRARRLLDHQHRDGHDEAEQADHRADDRGQHAARRARRVLPRGREGDRALEGQHQLGQTDAPQAPDQRYPPQAALEPLPPAEHPTPRDHGGRQPEGTVSGTGPRGAGTTAGSLQSTVASPGWSSRAGDRSPLK